MKEENRAYVLVKVSSGKDLEVFERIRGLQKDFPITEIAAVYGDYDLLVKIRFKKTEELEDLIFREIRRIPGVSETKTLFAARFVESAK